MENLDTMELDQLLALKEEAVRSNEYKQMLACYEALHHRFPQNDSYLDGCIYSSVMSLAWDKAIYYGHKGILNEKNYLNSLDGLSHAYHFKGDAENCRKYGSLALYFRHQQIIAGKDLPVLPDVALRDGKKIISFSLFGGENPKYIESAVLNAELVSRIYPHWICRFYIDYSIPSHIRKRLIAHGAEVFICDESLHHIPKTMWRFLPLNDPTVSCVIFRDADSVISRREAAAVDEWLNSGKYFHTIRDNGSQTDLVMAGMWGAICGVIPNVIEMMNEFVAKGELDKRFADQDFLKNYLWQYICQSLYATDSVFDFLDSHPFPIAQTAENFVGRIESSSSVTIEGKWCDGTQLKWALYSYIDPLIAESYDEFTLLPNERFICEYISTVKGNKLTLNLPRRYIKHFKYSRLEIKVLD